MKYRICYGCGKVRYNLFLEYLSLCVFCKIKWLFTGKQPNKLGEELKNA